MSEPIVIIVGHHTISQLMAGEDVSVAGVLMIPASDLINETMPELVAKNAEIARLREALEPFAKAADIKLCGEWRDDQRFSQTDVGFYLSFGDLRAARAALKEQKP